ncbi:hypothetical protein LAUMK136_04308 [Mycobacterium attenuatum]|uniref:Uncharacterized protein n=1 Tax=Mycobacterium attenuatum TaxID=2341086 RepID=A0A498Q8P6_9MYCO|nr:hypothetical protein LAUMK136_04308 [Mycobacterium attenuatum]
MLQAAVVVGRDADEHAGATAGEPLRHLPGVFQSLPSHFEKQALPGVHTARLVRRDAEKVSVEPVDLVQEPTTTGAAVARGVRVPAVRRCLGDGVHAIAEQLPECRRPVGAREAATDPDDGDRLGYARRTVLGYRRRYVGGCVRTLLRSHIFGEEIDRGVLVGDRRREFAPEPRFQCRGQPDGTDGVQTVVRERHRRVDFRCWQAEFLREPGDQPRRDLGGAAPGACWPLFDRRWGRARIARGRRMPLGEHLEAAVEEPLPAGVAPDLSARGCRDA